MNHYLLFRLYGPMATWGDIAVGEYRPSQAHPSRTAVLGLLAAALGIRRDREEELIGLDRSVRLAMRLDIPGELLRDYHTTQVAPAGKKLHYYTRSDETKSDKLHTILSQRDYRTDSGASIALQTLDGDTSRLRAWQQALKTPALPLFLGRKSCPLALPTDPIIVEAENLKVAFDSYPDCLQKLSVLSRHSLPEAEHFRYFWEGEDQGLNPQLTYPRHDRLLSRRRWQFASRDEHQATYTRTPSNAPDKES